MKTVKARIPVLVDQRGFWASAGYSWTGVETDWSMMEEMLMESTDESQPGNLQRVWIEVDMPVPDAEDQTVQGHIIRKEDHDR